MLRNTFSFIKEFVSSALFEYSEYKRTKSEYERFKKTIKDLSFDRQSKFNELKLTVSEDGLKVEKRVDVPENFQISGEDWQIYDKLNENVFKSNLYLREELGFGDRMMSPEFWHVEDPEDTERDSCTYIAQWKMFTDVSYHNYEIFQWMIVVVSTIIAMISWLCLPISITLGTVILIASVIVPIIVMSCFFDIKPIK